MPSDNYIGHIPTSIIVAGAARREGNGNVQTFSPLQADQAPFYHIPLSVTSQVPTKQSQHRLPLKMVISEVARRNNEVQTMSQNTEYQHCSQTIDDLFVIPKLKIYRGHHNMSPFNHLNKSMDLTNKKRKQCDTTMTSNSQMIDNACRKYYSFSRHGQYPQQDVRSGRHTCTHTKQSCLCNPMGIAENTTNVAPKLIMGHDQPPASEVSSLYSSLPQINTQHVLPHTHGLNLQQNHPYNNFQGLMKPYISEYMKSGLNNVCKSSQSTKPVQQMNKTKTTGLLLNNVSQYYNETDLTEVTQKTPNKASRNIQVSNTHRHKYPTEMAKLHNPSSVRLFESDRRNTCRSDSTAGSDFSVERFIDVIDRNKTFVDDVEEENIPENKKDTDYELKSMTVSFPDSYDQESKRDCVSDLNSYSNLNSNNDSKFVWKPKFHKRQVIYKRYDSNVYLANNHSKEEDISRIHNAINQNYSDVNPQIITAAVKERTYVNFEGESYHSDTESQSTASKNKSIQKSLLPCFTDPDVDNYLASEESLDSTSDE